MALWAGGPSVRGRRMANCAETKAEVSLVSRSPNDPPQFKLLVCVNAVAGSRKQCCAQRGSEALAAELKRRIEDRAIDATVEPIVCLGNCHRGPSMRIAPGGRFFFEVGEAELSEIVDALEQAAGTRERDEEPLVFPGA